MHKRFIKYILILALFVVCGIFSHAQKKWKLRKDKNDIKVFSKITDQSDFEAFKAKMLVDGSIQDFVAVLKDIESLPDWAHNVKYANLLERSGDTLQIFYSEAKAPFPFRNRDGIYFNRFRWIADSSKLFVDIELLHDYLEVKDKLVRVKGKGFWTVYILETGKLDVTFQMQVDPGGNIPAWLANIFMDNTPYFSMLKLREIMKKEKYRNQRFDFIY
jgi:hypothetical protein